MNSAALETFLGVGTAPHPIADIVRLPGNDVDLTHCAKELAARLNLKSQIFSHHGTCVEATIDGNGETALVPLRAEAAATRFQLYGVKFHAYYKEKEQGKWGFKPNPAVDTMKQLLAGGVLAANLRRVELVSPCPILVEDANGGLEILGPGYHAAHRVLINENAPPVPEVSVADALLMLDELTNEYAFENPGDCARMVADYLTPALVMGDLLGAQAPISITEANESQSGKGYHQRIVRASYRSRTSHVTQRKGGVGSFDEDICAAAVRAQTFMSLDNYRGKLDSPLLESALTAEKDTVQVRLPHVGQVVTSFRRRVIQLTSNGLLTTPDLANRANLVRIRKKHGHVFRKYPEGDLEAHVIAHQPRYLGAIFALVKAWHDAGKPRITVPGHDRRQWAGVMEWILKGPLFGMFGGLMDGLAEAKERLSNPEQNWLRNICVALERHPLDLAIEYRPAELAAFCANHDIAIPGIRPDTDDDGRRAVGVLMSRLFKRDGGHVVLIEGFVVTRTQTEELGPDRHMRPVNTFRFTSTRQSAPEVAASGQPLAMNCHEPQ